MANIEKPSLSPGEALKKQNSKRDTNNTDNTLLTFGKGICTRLTFPKIEIKQLKLEDVSSFTPEETERKVHAVDKMRSIDVLLNEIEIMENFIVADKANRKVYEEKKGKVTSQLKMMKKGLESGDIKTESYLQSIKKELAYTNALKEELRNNKCQKKDYNRVKDRIELLQSEIARVEAKAKGAVSTDVKKEEKKAKEPEDSKKVKGKEGLSICSR